MKKTILSMAAAGLMLAGTSFGFDNPPYGKRGNQQQRQTGQCDGTGKGNGRMSGPRDGSGPIHAPGTGGGNGAGRRAGRR